MPQSRIERPRKTDLREDENAPPHMASTGCPRLREGGQWRSLPKGFPPVSTAQRYFREWRDSRLGHTIRFHPVVRAADIKGRDGAAVVLKSIRHTCLRLRHPFADGAYAGPKLRGALERAGTWMPEIVKRSDTANCLEVVPRRRVVERTFAWLMCRRMLAQSTRKGATAIGHRSSGP